MMPSREYLNLIADSLAEQNIRLAAVVAAAELYVDGDVDYLTLFEAVQSFREEDRVDLGRSVASDDDSGVDLGAM